MTIREQVQVHGHVLLHDIELSQVTELARLFGQISIDKRSPNLYRKISPACGLHLKGAEEIAHTTLDTHFIATRSTSLHELYEPEYFLEYDNM